MFADKTSHFVASWYRPPSNTSGEFQLFREQLDCIRTHYKGNKKSYNILKRDNGLCFRIRIVTDVMNGLGDGGWGRGSPHLCLRPIFVILAVNCDSFEQIIN